MTWDWRKQFRRQFGYEPGTIVRTDHLVTTPAVAPNSQAKATKGKAAATCSLQAADGVASRPSAGGGARASIQRPRFLGDGVEARTIGRSTIVAECEPAPAPPVPMVEVGPGRRVNAVSFKKLRQGGDL